MEQFATEEQQVEAIKKFWKENGPAIVIGAVLGLGGLWGWRYYNEAQINAQEQASSQYELAVESVETDTASADKINAFISEHPESGYAVLAALQLAKEAVDGGNLDEAAKQLSFVIANAEEEGIAHVARIRLARVQIEQDKLDDALATLTSIEDEAFSAQVQELKGDVYVKQSLTDKARAAYSAALEDNQGNYLLKMKLDNLAAANG